MDNFRSVKSLLKRCVVLGAILVGISGAIMTTPAAAHADNIYYEFPIGCTGFGTVFEYNPDAGIGTWYWYDAHGNWGVMS